MGDALGEHGQTAQLYVGLVEVFGIWQIYHYQEYYGEV